MLIRHAVDFLYLCPLIKCEMNYVLGLLNHTLVGPFSVVGKTWHMISSATSCKCMGVLNDSR